MRRLGADCLVLAMKRSNARGAKGAGHRHWVGPTGNGRSLIISGRRQPSRDGTSRMNREVHVRICERLGVRYSPGLLGIHVIPAIPTRPVRPKSGRACPARSCCRASSAGRVGGAWDSLDHLIGSSKKSGWDGEAERLGGF